MDKEVIGAMPPDREIRENIILLLKKYEFENAERDYTYFYNTVVDIFPYNNFQVLLNYYKEKMVRGKVTEVEDLKREEEDRKRQAQQAIIEEERKVFVGLAKKYHVSTSEIVDESGPTLLALILSKLEENKSLDESELEWLKEKSIFNVLANYYYQRFLSNDEVWDLAKASSHFRDADMPSMAIRIGNGFTERSVINPKATGAVLTSRGGAFKDIHDFSQAKECAFGAIEVFPNSFYPYTLLGAVCYAEGEHAEGDEHFAMAESLGASPRAKDAEIRSVLKESSMEDRKTTIEYLLLKDPERYAWTKRFLP